jgi:hypothetical protein
MKRTTANLLAAAAIAGLSTAAWAVPTQVVGADTPGCDVLNIPLNVDELGTNVFPTNELISSKWLGPTTILACPTSAGAITSQLIEITNLTTTTWNQVWYVGDPGTTITNEDGIVAGQHALLINKLATDLNSPLVFESGPVDNMFQPGETWDFVLDGYFNQFGLTPELFGQVGVPDTFPIPPIASGNIIATPLIPEPSAVSMVMLGACALLARRRR